MMRVASNLRPAPRADAAARPAPVRAIVARALRRAFRDHHVMPHRLGAFDLARSALAREWLLSVRAGVPAPAQTPRRG